LQRKHTVRVSEAMGQVKAGGPELLATFWVTKKIWIKELKQTDLHV